MMIWFIVGFICGQIVMIFGQSLAVIVERTRKK